MMAQQAATVADQVQAQYLMPACLYSVSEPLPARRVASPQESSRCSEQYFVELRAGRGWEVFVPKPMSLAEARSLAMFLNDTDTGWYRARKIRPAGYLGLVAVTGGAAAAGARQWAAARPGPVDEDPAGSSSAPGVPVEPYLEWLLAERQRRGRR